MKRLLLLLVMLLAVPALGWTVATLRQSHFDSLLASKGYAGSQTFCANSRVRAIPELRGFCEDVDAIELMRDASIYVGTIVCALPLMFWLISLVIGKSRVGLALVFPSLVRVSLFALAPIVLAQGAIFVYAVFIAESSLLGRVHGVLLLIAGLGALFVCLTLIKHAFTLGGKQETQVAGLLLDRQTHPQMYQLVGNLARRLRARSPDSIIVGLDPTFFATSAKVKILGRPKPLEGETVFVSLPLSRVLSLEEIIAILGHELGHFRGKDTTYSLRFAPVYVGLGSALESVESSSERDGAFQLMALPAIALLSFMFEVFARNERKISRARELAADRAATEVASARALASALLKVAAFAPLWPICRRGNAERLDNGLVTRNLSMSFADIVRFDVDARNIADQMEALQSTRITHPTDSHPPIAERLAAMPGGAPTIGVEDVQLITQDGLSEIGDFESIERELTVLEHRLLLGAGVSALPEEKDLTDDKKFRRAALNAAYVLGATVINAGGHWTPAKLAAAQEGGVRLTDEFNQVDFREHCRYPQDSPDPANAAEMLSQALNDEGRKLIVEWLQGIAFAEVAPSQHVAEWLAYFEHSLSHARS